MKVLITDGNFKHTLAAVRSLGKKGIDVTVLSHMRSSISFFSRYTRRKRLAPDPERDDRFATYLLNLVEEESYDLLIPVSFAAVMQAARIRKELEHHTRVPIAGGEALRVAGSKGLTVRCAREIGIPVPETYYPGNGKEVEDLGRSVTYPVVVKGSEESGYVCYARSPRELKSCYERLAPYQPIIQEYIPGEGYGFFALYNQGQARAVFMHRRLREYPVTGGPSALAESIYDPLLEALGRRLLDHLGWHGVAMVEFKKQPDGTYVLMEVNPKFWGSLELAIASGVDFPYLLCRMAVEGDIEPVLRYRVGVRFRWPFPLDLFHAMTNPRAIPRFFADFMDPSIRTDIDPRDIAPNLVQLGMTAAEFLIRVREGRFWRPHGTPYR
ncbi:MAG: ATP-grasp domain-containing protein [Methanomicrobiales archaeon]|jgi:predicted ATP-grasp superfamily ATP-dependent carboligase